MRCSLSVLKLTDRRLLDHPYLDHRGRYVYVNGRPNPDNGAPSSPSLHRTELSPFRGHLEELEGAICQLCGEAPVNPLVLACNHMICMHHLNRTFLDNLFRRSASYRGPETGLSRNVPSGSQPQPQPQPATRNTNQVNPEAGPSLPHRHRRPMTSLTEGEPPFLSCLIFCANQKHGQNFTPPT